MIRLCSQSQEFAPIFFCPTDVLCLEALVAWSLQDNGRQLGRSYCPNALMHHAYLIHVSGGSLCRTYRLLYQPKKVHRATLGEPVFSFALKLSEPIIRFSDVIIIEFQFIDPLFVPA